jgi:Ca2+-binding RTX toxin-like protein
MLCGLTLLVFTVQHDWQSVTAFRPAITIPEPFIPRSDPAMDQTAGDSEDDMPPSEHTRSVNVQEVPGIAEPDLPRMRESGGTPSKDSVSDVGIRSPFGFESSPVRNALPTANGTAVAGHLQPTLAPASVGGQVTQAEVDALEAGLGLALDALEDSLVEEVLTETLPLVGDRFAAAHTNNVAGFRYLNTLRTALLDALDGLTTGGNYDPAAVKSAIDTKLASAGFAAGSVVTVTTNNDQVQVAFVTSDTFAAAGVPIASDFGLPNLDLDLLEAKNASTVIAVTLRFTAGVDATGFYVEANAPGTLFTINTTTTVSTSLNARVRFAKLPFRLNDDNSPRSNMTANFAMTFQDADGKIRSAELGGMPDLLDATVAGVAALSLTLTSDLSSVAVLPGLRTDLTLNWNYGTPPMPVNPDDDNTSFGSAPALSLRNNSIQVGTFFSAFSSEVVRAIADVTAPLQPLIDILTAEIPLLSDLGSDAVTILHVAGASESQVAAIAGLNALAGLTSYSAASTVWMNMGSFNFNGDLRTELLEDLDAGLLSVPGTVPTDLAQFLSAAHGIAGLDFPILERHEFPLDPHVLDGRQLANLLVGRPADLFTYKSGTIELGADFQMYYPVLGPIGVTLGGRAGVKTQFGFGFDTQGVFDYYDAGPNATPEMLFNGFYAIAADGNGDPFTGISLYAGVTAGVEANIGFAQLGVEGDITAEIGFYLDENEGDEYGRIRAEHFATVPLTELFYAYGSLSAGLRAYVEAGIGPFSVGVDWESPRVTLISFDSRDEEVPVLAEPDPGNAATLILNVGTRAPRRLYGNLDDRAEEFLITADGGLTVTAFDEENVFPAPSLIVGNPNERGDLIELEADVDVPARLHGGAGRDVLSGGAAADELEGDADPDKLRGRGGNDTLRGGGDNDELIGGPGADILDGDSGEDTASWTDALALVTIDLRTGVFTGEAALDTLISIERYKGSPFADVMDGSEGFDGLLNGDAGNDLIHGHGGEDLIEGGGGDDSLFGDAGNDLINGGTGADTMSGGDGTDILSYMSAAPPLPAGVVLEPVTVNLLTGLGTRGDAAGDVLSGFEVLYGSSVPAGVTSPAASGDDLTGSDSAESIHGMGGADLIRGGGGNDLLYGDSSETTEEFAMEGFDADTIHGDAGDDQIFGQSDDDKLYGGDGLDMLDGGSGDDELEGNEDNDVLDAGPGDDKLDGGPGNDTLLAGEGDDYLQSADVAGIDTLHGGPGYNRLTADYSDKTTPLLFTVGSDNTHTFPDGDGFSTLQTLGTLITGSANDVIRLSASQEPYYWPKSVTAGAGDDLVLADWRGYYSVGGSLVHSNDNLHGGDGNDTISFEHSTGRVTVNLSTGGLGGVATGMTMSGFENITGSNHIDNLTGDAGPNIFRPLRGGPTDSFPNNNPDSINGGGGEDTLIIDYSNDERANAQGVSVTPNQTTGFEAFVLGPEWNGFPPALHAYLSIERFHITGSAMPDRLYGEDGVHPDIFIGLGGNDLLESRNGDDFVDGGDGNDTLNGGGGHDIILGGPGNDLITFLRHTTAFNEGWLGTDTLDAGPGDDVVTNLWAGAGAGPPGANVEAGSVFRADGGSGYDALNADFSNQSLPMIFDQSNPANFDFPNGSYIRSFEFLKDFVAGSGNDVFTFRGRENSRIQMFGGNDVINPGLGVDIAYGGTGTDLLIIDYSVGDDANAGGITSTSATVHTRADVITGAVLDRVTTAEMERSHITGTSKADTMRGQNGDDTFFGGGGSDILYGNNGNDYLDGGPGADQMWGGPNNDFYIVDDAADIVRELNTSGFDEGGMDTVRSSVSMTLPAGPEILHLTGSALNGTGNSYANTITGNAQNNLLQGLNGNDSLNGGGGPNEVDRLNGGANADTFVLGDGSVRFYDDGDPLSPGIGGYAVIEDFTPAQTDRLRLTGSAAQYFLGVSPVAGVSGTALYHDSNASGVLETATDELVAIINSPVALTPANTLTPGTYPPPVTPESIGLTEPPVVTTSDPDGQGSRLTVQFTISEPMPAGALLAIQASTDLGIHDPWQTIASKNGPGAWSGLAPVTTGPPANGSVTVTLTDLPPTPGQSRRFLRFHLAAP